VDKNAIRDAGVMAVEKSSTKVEVLGAEASVSQKIGAAASNL
jgi:hypothetical protein